jgi:hypothetical protein
MATYHGLIEVSCIVCKWNSTDESTIEVLNDLAGNCPECQKQFFRWENQDGSIVVSLVDGENEDYDNLVLKEAK